MRSANRRLPTDLVFDAALRARGDRSRAHLYATVRGGTHPRRPEEFRAAIGLRSCRTDTGRGVLAADPRARLRRPACASSEPVRCARSTRLLPPECPRANPVDVRGDAPPARFAEAVAIALADGGRGAVLALHVPRPVHRRRSRPRRAVAQRRASASPKPVLAAWLGAVSRPRSAARRSYAGNVANFYTPENAVDAFSFSRCVSPATGMAARSAFVASGSRSARSCRGPKRSSDGTSGRSYPAAAGANAAAAWVLRHRDRAGGGGDYACAGAHGRAAASAIRYR